MARLSLGCLLVLLALPRPTAAQPLRVEAVRLPAGTRPSSVDTTREEAAFVQLGIRARGGGLPAAERDGLETTMRRAYERLHDSLGAQPSVWRASVLRDQRAASFDALDVGPRDADAGLVFLHGHGGNFAWQCLLVARAAAEAGARTLCPSVGRRGRWWRGEGPDIVEAAVETLRSGGVSRIVLAGLSNGGVGASRLAARVRPAGLILIGGVASGTRTARPALLIHGRADRMVGAGAPRAFVRRSPQAELRWLPGGHFAAAAHEPRVRRWIARWLRGLRADGRGSPGPGPHEAR